MHNLSGNSYMFTQRKILINKIKRYNIFQNHQGLTPGKCQHHIITNIRK